MATRIVYVNGQETVVTETEDQVVEAVRRDHPNPVKLERFDRIVMFVQISARAPRPGQPSSSSRSTVSPTTDRSPFTVTSCEHAVITAVDPGNASNPTVKELAMHSLIQIDLARTLAQERARQISARPDGRDHDRSRVPRARLRRRRVRLTAPVQAAPLD